jgi:glycosyltransferase involved in cell wall biosynthesis
MNRHPELDGKRAAVLLFSYYPADPRPRRAAEALARTGMQVQVICLRHSDEPPREQVDGVDVSRLPLRRRRGGAASYLFQYSVFILSTFLMLAARSIRRRYALVHVHNMPDILVFSALVPRLLGAKVILDLHDPMPELMASIFGLGLRSFGVRLLERFERWSIAFADLVLTVNIACQRIFAARSHPRGQIQVIMNAPDEGIFAFRRRVPASLDPSRRLVLMYHGSLVERNGVDLAVAALGLVRPWLPAAELRIYGESTPFLQTVLETVRRNGMQDAVRYLGAKSLDDIVRAIDDCDVGIIPNRRTLFTEINTPTRIFEYLSRGKPVITGRAAGVRDYFPDDSLFFFELGDAADLARSILELARHPESVDTVVTRGQAVYLAHRWAEECDAFIGRTAALFRAGDPPRPVPTCSERAGAR